MYLYKFGAGHQGRNSNLAVLHESDAGHETLPMQMVKLKEIPHNRTKILFHNVRLYSQEARKERTHSHLVIVVLWTSGHILYGLPLHQKGDISKATC